MGAKLSLGSILASRKGGAIGGLCSRLSVMASLSCEVVSPAFPSRKMKCPLVAGIGLTHHVYRKAHRDRMGRGHEALGLRIQTWFQLHHPPHDTEDGESTLLMVPWLVIK